ncbi:hypothetical protein [Acrocarpospora sp. B8E8]|uniref:hypothetical protein n=1 Tax=Acrocarpospora sp. B8E8 TaxID=3153572 RepID=UPI00325DA177
MTERKPQVFTETELREIKEDIDRARRPGAYESGRWSVSPLNRDPEVAGRMPTSVRFRDITLRAIEALPGVVVSTRAKSEYLRQLVEAGVPEIVTAGVRDRGDDELRRDIEMVKSIDPDRRVTCPLVFSARDLAAPARAGYDAVQIWVPPWGTASRLYEAGVHAAAWRGDDWRDLGLPSDRAGFVARAADLVTRARDLGLEVTAPLLMVSFLSIEELLETCSVLVHAGANEIGLFDGPGAMSPEAYGHLVAQTKAHFPDVRVGIHPHNTFGLAVAAAIAAARNGVDVVEVSVNGYCGGPGNADLSVATAAFEALYGVETGIRPERLKALAQAGERLTGYRTAYNHPVTGDRVYNWGGMDFITQELGIDDLLHNAIAPGWSGSTVDIPITEVSGPFTLWDKMIRLGLAPTHQTVETALGMIKSEIEKQGSLLTDAQVKDLCRAAGAPTAPMPAEGHA